MKIVVTSYVADNKILQLYILNIALKGSDFLNSIYHAKYKAIFKIRHYSIAGFCVLKLALSIYAFIAQLLSHQCHYEL